MNFDPRCLSLSTEMGVLFEDASLIREISAVFDDEASPQDSYRVVDEGGGVRWQDGPPTNAKILLKSHSPACGAACSGSRRLVAD